MKQCKFCHAALPEEALFCPFCEKEQVEKLQVHAPRPMRRWAILALLLALALLAAGSGILMLRPRHTPQVYHAGAPAFETQYTAEDGVNYRLFLTFAETAEEAEPCRSIRLPAPEDGKGQVVSLLIAVPEGSSSADGAAFAKLLERAEICSAELNGSDPLEHGEAVYDADRPFAAAAVTLSYDARSWYNELGWVLHMKNGDVLYLHHYVHVDGSFAANNAGAPAVELRYAAEDGVSYRLFLSFAETAEEAEPCESVSLPTSENGTDPVVSRLCAVSEGGTLLEGAAFGELIEQVDVHMIHRTEEHDRIEHNGAPYAASRPFAAAVTLDRDEFGSESELLWIIRMKNGDVLYLHQLVAAQNGGRIYNAGAPAYDMRYTAEDGASYRVFLSNTEDAEPCEVIHLPLPGSGAGRFVSLLCAVPEGPSSADGAAFGELIEAVTLGAIDCEKGAWLFEGVELPLKPDPPSVAAATLEYDRRWSSVELIWTLSMKNGDVIYLHQLVFAGEAAS